MGQERAGLGKDLLKPFAKKWLAGGLFVATCAFAGTGLLIRVSAVQ